MGVQPPAGQFLAKPLHDGFFTQRDDVDCTLGIARDHQGILVVGGHEDLLSHPVFLFLVTETACNIRLVEIIKLVILSVRKQVNLIPDGQDHRNCIPETAQLILIETGQLPKVFQLRRVGDGEKLPANRMHIPQATGRTLQVGFKQVDRVRKLGAPLNPTPINIAQEPAAEFSTDLSGDNVHELAAEGLVATYQTGLRHRCR